MVSLTGAIIITIILLIILAVSIYYFVTLSITLNKEKNTENIMCPTFYCQPVDDGNVCQKNGSSYRYDKNKKLQCQQLTIGNSSTLKNYSEYVK